MEENHAQNSSQEDLDLELFELGTESQTESSQPSTAETVMDLQRASGQEEARRQTEEEIRKELNDFMSNVDEETLALSGMTPEMIKKHQEEVMASLQNMSMEDFEKQQQLMLQAMEGITPEEIEQRQEEFHKALEENPDFAEFMSEMQNQINHVMDRENLQPFIEPLCNQFPAWLRAHEHKLDAAEKEQYRAQHRILQQIMAAYADRSKPEEVTRERVLQLFAEFQQHGSLPEELLAEVVPRDFLHCFESLASGDQQQGPQAAQGNGPPSAPSDPMNSPIVWGSVLRQKLGEAMMPIYLMPMARSLTPWI
eukprot:gnl/Trimastix_PCT/2575.p1 GENE.gnl/Trimastix_PCT/2575~~gnl/Trimastix_PCT/2575.p1  ORF type:complete len:319 (-),score=86.61 gnl/Trimastix_PCT/2575:1657-2586(-)